MLKLMSEQDILDIKRKAIEDAVEAVEERGEEGYLCYSNALQRYVDALKWE